MIARTLVCSLLTLTLCGCGRETTVTGNVTYGGKAVEKGFITFHPVKDSGATAGAAIINGKFEISNLAAGKRRVQITSEPVATLSAAGKVKIDASKTVPQSARGNFKLVDINGIDQEVNIELR